METFAPVENSNLLYVDHIDGVRTNNKLSNLRWVTAKENMLFRHENWAEMSSIFEKLIQKYGYDDTKSKLLSLLE